MDGHAFLADQLFDGVQMHRGHALVVAGSVVEAIMAVADLPPKVAITELGGGTLAPGFVDLQVNGGGGIMFNDAPTVDTLKRIAAAHIALGTTAFLPTLITDTPQQTKAAIDAAISAIEQGVPGIAGLHLEGPHLSVARKGAHDPTLIRPMSDADLDLLCKSVQRLPSMKVTVAPETVSPEQIAAMTSAGIVVSLGHSDADYDTCIRAVRAGARCATHLFNAMSQLAGREPGLVGAVLSEGALGAGLIADAVHVHPVTIGAALRAKSPPGEVFLVTDAMATAGSDIDRFTLNDRRIERRDERLTLADGTLAGADLDMARAVAVMTAQVGLPLDNALTMATSAPARVLGRHPELGALTPGGIANFIHLGPDLSLKNIWRGGQALV